MHQRRRGRTARSGFTLTETLIVIVMLIAVSAIAWPVLTGFVRDQAVTESAYRLTRELDAVRVRSVREGYPMLTRIEQDADGLTRLIARRLGVSELSLLIDGAAGLDDDLDGAQPGLGAAGGGFAGGQQDDADEGRSVLMSFPDRIDVRMPGELTATDERSLAASSPAPPGPGAFPGFMPDPEFGMLEGEPAARRWLVAVYLPDGSAVPGAGVELADRGTPLDMVRVVVTPTLARAVRERVAPVDPFQRATDRDGESGGLGERARPAAMPGRDAGGLGGAGERGREGGMR